MVKSVFVLLDILSDNTKYYQLSVIQWYLIKMQVKYRSIVFYSLLFLLKFVGIVFLSSSHVITESSIIFGKYLPTLQLHVAGFQI